MQITIKKLETIMKNQEQLENWFAKMKPELKAMDRRVNNAEEWLSDLENIIMETIQS